MRDGFLPGTEIDASPGKGRSEGMGGVDTGRLGKWSVETGRESSLLGPGDLHRQAEYQHSKCK